MGRVMKTQAQVSDCKALFTQNHIKAALCQAWLYDRLHHFIFEVLWTSGVSHFVLTHSPCISSVGHAFADSNWISIAVPCCLNIT